MLGEVLSLSVGCCIGHGVCEALAVGFQQCVRGTAIFWTQALTVKATLEDFATW